MDGGTLTKVWLRFDEVAWPAVDWLEHVPPAARRGWFHQWFNAAPALGVPLLCGFLGGRFGVAAERARSDDALAADAVSVLRAMLGDVPTPVGVQVTRWSGDPLAWGAYSFHPVGARPPMRDALAEPLTPRLVLAGEASDRAFFGTVHGAYRSGERAAEQLLARR
jgi:monoamine oxidase